MLILDSDYMYLDNETFPVSPPVPRGHKDGAVLSRAPIEAAGHSKAEVELLARVVVAPHSLSLRVATVVSLL